MTALTEAVRAWKESGSFALVDDVELFYRIGSKRHGDLPWLVCFHGFPTSSWDWHRLLPLLEQTYRVLVFDFPGYGLSAKPPDRNYSLLRQLDAAEALLRFLQITEFDLLAHDMGNSVACELLYRREQGGYPFALRSLALLNGGIYMELHKALLTQKLLRTPVVGAVAGRLTSWGLFRRQYPNVYADPDRFNEAHYHGQWSLMLNNRGRRVLHRIAGYMKERTRMGERWTGPLHRLDLPFRVIWGDRDPIAVYAIAQRLCERNPGASLYTLDGVGHYPQLEAPERVALALGLSEFQVYHGSR
jgi:pimeloyl-ACP methyl ester carboxylesterase